MHITFGVLFHKMHIYHVKIQNGGHFPRLRPFAGSLVYICAPVVHSYCHTSTKIGTYITLGLLFHKRTFATWKSKNGGHFQDSGHSRTLCLWYICALVVRSHCHTITKMGIHITLGLLFHKRTFTTWKSKMAAISKMAGICRLFGASMVLLIQFSGYQNRLWHFWQLRNRIWLKKVFKMNERPPNTGFADCYRYII